MRFRFMPFVLAIALIGCSAAVFATPDAVWVKGNMHTHTTNSDGDSDPQVVADWYKDHGYDFLFITDHAKVTDPAALKQSPGFILIPGEETAVKGAKKPIHGCALGIAETIPYSDVAATPAKSLERMVADIRKAGGIPQVNHPNFGWSFGYAELKGLKGPYLLEVFNGHPAVHNWGSEAVMSVEQVWDCLLSDGVEVYATATDDAHHFKEMAANKANPGRGWICASVPFSPSAEDILDAIRRGDFYASTGVEMDFYFGENKMNVWIVPKDGMKYWIRFIGKHGRILGETRGTKAEWVPMSRPEPNDYVRCKVIADDGTVAWTQAYRLGR